MTLKIQQVTENEIKKMKALMGVFAEAFSDEETYTSNQPSSEYLISLLRSEYFIVLVAIYDSIVVGGLVAYELKKFEQNRSEIYIYDLAVAKQQRRKGVATALIEALKVIGSKRNAYVVFVQADTSKEDMPAIELYSKLGTRAQVLHFDIPVKENPDET